MDCLIDRLEIVEVATDGYTRSTVSFIGVSRQGKYSEWVEDESRSCAPIFPSASFLYTLVIKTTPAGSDYTFE